MSFSLQFFLLFGDRKKNENGQCRFQNNNNRMNGFVIFHFDFAQSAYSIEELK